MTVNPQERLWLNGFATVSQVLAHDRLALEEVRQELERYGVSDSVWLAPWTAGFNAGLRASFGS
jgi:hypothetical protein